MRKHIKGLSWVAVCLFLILDSVQASTVTTSNFTDITDGIFIDLPGSNAVNPITVASVTITTIPSRLVGIYLGPAWAHGDAEDPADGKGYIAYRVIVNFSLPVAAFGATFSNITVSEPAILKVYDGLNGSGNLLGSIMSVPVNPPWTTTNNPNDFIAVRSDNQNILSAILIGTGTDKGIAVDGYGLSLTPIPEPSTFLLVAMGILSLFTFAWRRRKRVA